jgi:alpha-galactosidase
VNLPNDGAIKGLPDDVVIEGKGVVQNGRVQLLNVGALQEELMCKVLLPRWVQLEQTMSAVRRHDYSALRELVLADHRTKNTDQADTFLAEALASDYNSAVATWYGKG